MRLTRDEQGFKNLEGKEEKREFDSGLLLIEAERATRKAVAFAFKKKFPGFRQVLSDDPDIRNDIASYAVTAWYEIKEFDRPTDLIGIQSILFKAALRYLSREHSVRMKAMRLDGVEETESVYTARDYAGRKDEALQERRIMAIQAVNVIEQLPSDLKVMALNMAQGSTLPEAAAELGLDLYSAMKWQLEVRKVSQRIVEDGMAGNMFSDLAHKHKLYR